MPSKGSNLPSAACTVRSTPTIRSKKRASIKRGGLASRDDRLLHSRYPFWRPQGPEYLQTSIQDSNRMDAAMIARWNSVVASEDEVWHLGDFARERQNCGSHPARSKWPQAPYCRE